MKSDTAVPSRDRRPRQRLFPLGWLFGLLLFALGLAGLMIPRDAELVERLLEDGRHERALALVGATVAVEQADQPEDTAAVPDAATAADLLTTMLDALPAAASEADVARLDTLVRIVDDPAAVHAVLTGKLGRLPAAARPALLEALAGRALQTGDPALAARVYSEIDAIQPLSLDRLRRMILACRYSSQQRLALESVSRYLSRNRLPFTQLPADLRDLTVALHREVNEASQAFDLLSEEYRANLDPDHRQDLVELLTTTAAQSNRLNDTLPLLQDYLATTEAGRLNWSRLAARPQPHPTDGAFLKYGKLLAQFLEWNNQVENAFVLYRKLALLGDTESLDRCVVVYPWIDHQLEVTELLETLVPVKGRDAYTLLLARLLVERPDLEKAEAIFRSELKKPEHARDPEIWAELGNVLDVQNRFEEARDTFRVTLDLDPGRHDVRVRLARLHVTLGNYMAALLAYRKLPDDAHDRKTREDYGMLAAALDAPEDVVKATQLKIANETTAEADRYLDIADTWDSLARPDSVVTALEEGLKRLPESRVLKLRLADHLATMGRLSDAFDLLAASRHFDDPRFASRLLSLGNETGRFEETLALVQSAPAAAEPAAWSPTERLELAALYEETGDIPRALEIYRSTEAGTVDALRLGAEVAYLEGRVEDALSLQRRYLAETGDSDYEALTFLGDLLHAAGDAPAAEAAYRRALDAFKAQLAKGGIEPPAPPTVAATPARR